MVPRRSWRAKWCQRRGRCVANPSFSLPQSLLAQMQVALLLLGPLDRPLLQLESPANHQIAVPQNLGLPAVGLTVEAQLAGPGDILLS